MADPARDKQPSAKRRMQASSSDEVSTHLISAASGPARREHGNAYSSSGGAEPLSQVHASGSMDSLAVGLRAQASLNSGSDEDSGFEDKSESISSVYSKLMTDYRVNICLYNRDHETHYRPKVPTPPVSHRKSPSPSSALGVRGLTLSSVSPAGSHNTPPHSPSPFHLQPLPTQHHPFGRTGTSRSVSTDNLDMSDAVSTASSHAPHNTAKPNTMWDIAQKRNLEETPKLSIGEIIGLKEVKTQLELMLVPYVDSRKKLLFSVGQQSQPDRTLFVRSEKGSGIHTLVNAVCKKSGVNLIRVSYGTENEWDNRLFTKLLDFALAIQPVAVFFDRCDAWFAEKGEGWRHRGDKFILALEGNALIANGRADVLFVVSASEYLASMHPRFVQWIKPYRSVPHRPFDQTEAQQFLYQALNFHINEIQTAIQAHHNTSMLEYGGLVVAASEEMEQLNKVNKLCDEKRLQTKELAAKICSHFKGWTPAMISLVVSRAIDMARTRELSRQEPSTHYDIVNLVPTTIDVVAVINSIMKTEPGIIVWKGSQ